MHAPGVRTAFRRQGIGRQLLAAGDARAGSTKQLVSAAGEGATATLMIRQFLQQTREARPAAETLERDAAATVT